MKKDIKRLKTHTTQAKSFLRQTKLMIFFRKFWSAAISLFERHEAPALHELHLMFHFGTLDEFAQQALKDRIELFLMLGCKVQTKELLEEIPNGYFAKEIHFREGRPLFQVLLKIQSEVVEKKTLVCWQTNL